MGMTASAAGLCYRFALDLVLMLAFGGAWWGLPRVTNRSICSVPYPCMAFQRASLSEAEYCLPPIIGVAWQWGGVAWPLADQQIRVPSFQHVS